jgi:hypothetical protein
MNALSEQIQEMADLFEKFKEAARGPVVKPQYVSLQKAFNTLAPTLGNRFHMITMQATSTGHGPVSVVWKVWDGRNWFESADLASAMSACLAAHVAASAEQPENALLMAEQILESDAEYERSATA